jgi:hypothetical protein
MVTHVEELGFLFSQFLFLSPEQINEVLSVHFTALCIIYPVLQGVVYLKCQFSI